MIRPVHFGFNAETAVNNAFQVPGRDANAQEKALEEFDGLVDTLRENDIDVIEVDDTPEPHTPDSIFPNNWISMHADGTIFLYPMFAGNRRKERKTHVLEVLSENFRPGKTIDLTGWENKNLFLEGTGSMVLDRGQKVAYACLSDRTSETVLKDFCRISGYSYVAFHATDASGQPIYHTNVMMCVADRYVVICLDAIKDPAEREQVVARIKETGKAIEEINFTQLNHFAGNMLQVHTKKGEKLLVMSSQAFQSLGEDQLDRLRQYNRIVHASLDAIETNGGGSARCMMAEIYLPELNP